MQRSCIFLEEGPVLGDLIISFLPVLRTKVGMTDDFVESPAYGVYFVYKESSFV